MSHIRNIHLKLGPFTLDIPTLEILDSGITALVGPSGSGKSTFFKVLMGIYQPVGWSWDLKGIDLAQLKVSDRRLGVVFQGDELFPHLTAEENIKIILNARGADASKLNRYVDKLRLNSAMKTKAAHLSGGEKQRVSLLRALMANSRIILMDEPFSTLDHFNKVEAIQLVKDMSSEFKIPICFISHDPEDVKLLADKIIRMEHGKVT